MLNKQCPTVGENLQSYLLYITPLGCCLKKKKTQGYLGGTGVKCMTPGFGSGLDLGVARLSPTLCSVLSQESA